MCGSVFFFFFFALVSLPLNILIVSVLSGMNMSARKNKISKYIDMMIPGCWGGRAAHLKGMTWAQLEGLLGHASLYMQDVL
jgi:hypothetical protein